LPQELYCLRAFENLAGGAEPQWQAALQQGQSLQLPGGTPPIRITQSEVDGVRTDSCRIIPSLRLITDW